MANVEVFYAAEIRYTRPDGVTVGLTKHYGNSTVYDVSNWGEVVGHIKAHLESLTPLYCRFDSVFIQTLTPLPPIKNQSSLISKLSRLLKPRKYMQPPQ